MTGTRGSLVVDGATLRARLGLYDTWASFWTITARPVGAAGRGRADRVLALTARTRGRASLAGTVFSARRGTAYVLQERTGGRWTTVRHARLRARGAYRVAVPHAGVFRVLCGGGVGPAVSVG